MAKKTGNVMCDGTIDTNKIEETHKQIKKIVSSFKETNLAVSMITLKVQDNWVGAGRNEFENQYNQLIKKIDDFGETLQDIYDGLVQAEAEYEAADDSLRQEFVMSTKK